MSILATTPATSKTRKPEALLYSWTLPPVQGWGLLTIRGTVYRLREVHYDECDGTPRMLVRLLRSGAEHEYQLARNADGDLCCDCADAIYRSHERTCKHCEAVTAAYAELDRQARLADFLESDPEAATLRLIAADGAMIDALLDAAEAEATAADRALMKALDDAEAAGDEFDAIVGTIDPTPPAAA